MELLLGLILIFCVFGLPNIIRDYKFNHSLPPAGYQADFAAMNRDFALKSKTEVKDKFNRGEYFVRKD